MTEWTLDKIKELLHDDCPDTVEVISAAWWLVRALDEERRVSGIIYNNLSKSVQRRLDARGVELDAEKGKISSQERGFVRQSRRFGRRSGDGGGGPFTPIDSD